MNRMCFFVASLLFSVFFNLVFAQGLTQNIRGRIVDKDSRMTLPGVSVQVISTEPKLGVSADVDGSFEIKNVPVGKVDVVFSMMGYKPVLMKGLKLMGNKELILNVQMVEMITKLGDVVIKNEKEVRDRAKSASAVSARSFDFEDTNKFAGSLGDPARMVQNYAGVNSAGDSRNDIVIRGNSPFGVLWKVNGLNVHNPNHFGTLGTTGGAVTILNNNLLESSDFFTAAFPSKYGNAVAGVFDVEMREGNNKKNEFLGQVGFNGFELAAEGPVGDKGSYMANYRYSTVEIFDKLGFNIGISAIPKFQDFTFRVDLPTGQKYGKFSLWGIGGVSNIDILQKDKEEGDVTNGDASSDKDVSFSSDLLMGGLKHTYFFSDKVRQEINIGYSGTRNLSELDSLNVTSGNFEILKENWYYNKSHENKILASYDLRVKWDAQNTFTTGVSSDVISYKYFDKVWIKNRGEYSVITDSESSTYLLQSYLNWQHRLSDEFTTNLGVHQQYLALSDRQSIEPRFNAKYQFTPSQSINVGVGMHSQILPMVFYLREDADGKLTNDKLDFYKSVHYVLGYDYKLGLNWSFKAEAYYQNLYDIPVSPNEDEGHFSLLNMGSSFNIQVPANLENTGTGENYGVDLTIEKNMADNYYILLTGSLYESKYKGYDKVERSTLWNANYAVTALTGVEFDFGPDIAKQTFGANIKFNYTGGNRYTPVDMEESRAQRQEVLKTEDTYKKQLDDFMRLDVRISYKLDTKYITQEWAVDLQNILNRKNIFRRKYDPQANEILLEYQQMFLPVGTYRIYF